MPPIRHLATAATLVLAVYAVQYLLPSASDYLPGGALDQLPSAQWPLYFEESAGHLEEAAEFIVRGNGYLATIALEGVTFRTDGPKRVGPVQIRWTDPLPSGEIRGIDRLESTSNYFIGQDSSGWRTGVPHYSAVRHASVLPGIDLHFYGNPHHLEFDIEVLPGAEISSFEIEITGADQVDVTADGDLRLSTAEAEIIVQAPFIYQMIDGRRLVIEGGFEERGMTRFGIWTEPYDASVALIVDPTVLVYGSFLGGSGIDGVRGLALDDEGNIFVAGITENAGWVAGPQIPPSGHQDLYVFKLSPDAKSLLWAGFMGGENYEGLFGMDLDDKGNVYLTGYVDAIITDVGWEIDYPRTVPFFGQIGEDAAFVTRVDPATNSLGYSVLFGGAQVTYSRWRGWNSGRAVAVDHEGNAYVVGETDTQDFPTTEGAWIPAPCSYETYECPSWHDQEIDGDMDGFVCKFSPDGTPTACTLIGSFHVDPSFEIMTDNDDDDLALDVALSGFQVYVAGSTEASCHSDPSVPLSTFYTHGSAFMRSEGLQGTDCSRGASAFVTGLNHNTLYPEVSTLLGGGDGLDVATSVAIDDKFNVLVAGTTNATDFPVEKASQPELSSVTLDCFVSNPQNCDDAFVAKLDLTLSTLDWATYLGGASTVAATFAKPSVGEEFVRRIYADDRGSVYVTGNTPSDLFPLENELPPGGLQGPRDAFVTKFDPSGKRVLSTYLGGSGWDGALDVVVNQAGLIIVGGSTTGPDYPDPTGDPSDFPVKDGLQMEFGGGLTDGFLVMLGTQDLSMDPEGVAFDPENYDLNPGPAQSTFKDLRITGQNLDEPERLIFKFTTEDKEDLNIVATVVSATSTEIVYDLEVLHSAPLGKRNIYLKKKDDGNEVDLTSRLGKGFLISRGAVSFNQAVADRSLDNEELHRVQISKKHGVVRFKFDDSGRWNETYSGTLTIRDHAGTSTSLNPYPVKETYSDHELLEGKDHLTMPYPGTDGLEPGSYTFTCDLRSNKWHLRCPEIERTFVESDRVDIVGIIYEIPMPDGSIAKPTYTEADVVRAMEFLQKVYPVSGDQFSFTFKGTEPLPAKVQAEFDAAGGTFTKTVSVWLFLTLKELRDRTNQSEGSNHQIMVAFVDDGLISGGSLGHSHFSLCSALISTELTDVPLTTAHEIGHLVGSCASEQTRLLLGAEHWKEEDIQELNLGDEYLYGSFNCDVNPPVVGLLGGLPSGATARMTCPGSLLEPNTHGDRNGTFVSRTGFDPGPAATDVGPRFFWSPLTQGAPSDTVYNFMRGYRPKPNHKAWVSALVYNSLHMLFAPAAHFGLNSSIKSKYSGDFVEVLGVLGVDGTARVRKVETFVANKAPSLGIGPYSAELLDEAGSVLSSANFDVEFLALTNPPEPVDSVDFSVQLPADARARRIAIRKDGIFIAEKALSRHGPSVHITHPLSGALISGGMDLTWKATDPDGDPLTYTILVSRDGGAGYQPVDALLTETTYRLDPSLFGASDDVVIMVAADDGYNIGQATVSASVDSEPRISSVAPYSLPQGSSALRLTVRGDRFVDGATVHISGGGVSVLRAEYIGSDEIGIEVDVAQDAPVGPRTVTLTNPNSEATNQSGLLEVIARGEMNVQLSWSPPDSIQDQTPPRNLSAEILTSTMESGKGTRIQIPLSQRPTATSTWSAPAMKVQQDTLTEMEPNNFLEAPHELSGPAPIVVKGQLEVEDVGQIIVEYGTGEEDDVEDLFQVTTTAPGLIVVLEGFTSDSQLYVIEKATRTMVGFSVTDSDTEAELVDNAHLDAGTYLVGASVFDPKPGVTTTPYVLSIYGVIEGTVALDAYNVYRSLEPKAHMTGKRIAEIPVVGEPVDPHTWTDQGVPRIPYYYRVTAVYDGGESQPSNEVFVDPGVESNQSPTVKENMSDVTLLQGTEPYRMNLLAYFDDPDGDPLTFKGSSTDAGVAEVSIVEHDVEVQTNATGEALITIEADDGYGGYAKAVFQVVVPTGVATEEPETPTAFKLGASYPNPFGARTRIPVELASHSATTVEIFDLLGRHVATLMNGDRAPGHYMLIWDGETAAGASVPAGVYVVRMRTAGFEQSRTLVRLR